MFFGNKNFEMKPKFFFAKKTAISKFRITCFSVMLINDKYPVNKFSFRLHEYDMFY